MSVLTAIIPLFKPERKKEKMSDFTTWDKYPFTVDGVDFVSLIKPDSDIAKQVSKVPAIIFEQMNAGAIRNFIGEASNYSKSELQARLDEVNEGYNSAYVALA
jgi:hypothetical protein